MSTAGEEEARSTDGRLEREQDEDVVSPRRGLQRSYGDAAEDTLQSDPWQNGRDPWTGTGAASRTSRAGGSDSESTIPQMMPNIGRRRGGARGTYTQVSLPGQDHGTSARVIHDVPPTWDGKDPDNQAEPYLKLLRGWLQTTRSQSTQAGMTILHYAYGDLKTLINELDVDVLTAPNGGENVFQHIQKTYQDYIHKKLPKAMERALFDDKGTRQRDESMFQYTSKKRTLLNELAKADCELPSRAKGYLTLRGAKLNDRAWVMMETWLRGNYDFDEVVDNLKKLERPAPGRGGATHLCVFSEVQEHAYPGADVYHVDSVGAAAGYSSGASLIFMTESLFLIPECFDENDDELMDELAKYIDDPDILFVAGDIGDDFQFEEDEAVSILANLRPSPELPPQEGSR
jgi:hypothetical protein